jgi:hypothetical protein
MSGAQVEMKKTRGQKARDTVPLRSYMYIVKKYCCPTHMCSTYQAHPPLAVRQLLRGPSCLYSALTASVAGFS